MSDMFKKVIDTARETARDLADRGRDLAKKGQELAEQLGETAQDKMDDYNNGSLLGRLEARANELGSDLTISRTMTDKLVDDPVIVLWSVDFGPDTEVVGPDFKTTAEHALEVNVVPPVVPHDPTFEGTKRVE